MDGLARICISNEAYSCFSFADNVNTRQEFASIAREWRASKNPLLCVCLSISLSVIETIVGGGDGSELELACLRLLVAPETMLLGPI